MPGFGIASSYIVKSASAKVDDKNVPDLPGTGSKITIEAFTYPGLVFTIDDKPAVGQAAGLIAMLVFIGDANQPELEALSPKDPVLVGSTWHVANLAFIAGPKSVDPSLDPNFHVTSQMKLDSVSGTGDDQAVTVSGQISIGRVSTSPENRAAGTIYTYNLAVPATTSRGTFKYTRDVKEVSQVTATSTGTGKSEATPSIEWQNTMIISYL
jgi:hypothetical protein